MNAGAWARDARAALAEAGVPEADFEAELLVRKVVGLSRTQYYAKAEIPPAKEDELSLALARRLSREPSAYILGRRPFMGREFVVGPGVLIPRIETELLVALAIEEEVPKGAMVADIGVGSGCVAISVKLERPDLRVVGVDRSAVAVATALSNLRRLGARIRVVRGHLASCLRTVDVVLANLPYIPSGEIAGLQPEVRDWEPRLALDGGEDGLALIRELIRDCSERLHPRLLGLEVMEGQANEVADLAAELGARTQIRDDFSGIPRVVCARWR